MTAIYCQVCRQPGGILALSGPCLECARARQGAAMDGRCHCQRQLRQPREVSTRSRSWVTCDRCFGTIRQTG